MKSRKLIRILIISTICISQYSCKTEQPVLNGDIIGNVTEDEFLQPVQSATVKISTTDDTAITGIDGKYQFNNLAPGEYQVEASKPPYEKYTQSAVVKSAQTTQLDFVLHKIPYPLISPKYLDYGFDSTLNSFTITNTGTGSLNYSIIASQDWIDVSPNIGEVKTEPDTIKVTINRTGLSEDKNKPTKYMESIEIVSHVGQDLIRDTVEVFVNGVMDQDSNYYRVVTIGTQTWMAENLNIGRPIPLYQEQTNNGIIEKWCYDCETYGGLYTWYEAMQYNPSDTGTIGTTQGICPDGWHIPTPDELYQLLNYCGGNKDNDNYANRIYWAKLKEVGFTHWPEPNTGAIDTFGFTALPGGNTDGYNPEIGLSDPSQNKFFYVGEGFFMLTSEFIPAFDIGWSPNATCLVLRYCLGIECFNGITPDNPWSAKSVRCIKDP